MTIILSMIIWKSIICFMKCLSIFFKKGFGLLETNEWPGLNFDSTEEATPVTLNSTEMGSEVMT